VSRGRGGKEGRWKREGMASHLKRNRQIVPACQKIALTLVCSSLPLPLPCKVGVALLNACRAPSRSGRKVLPLVMMMTMRLTQNASRLTLVARKTPGNVAIACPVGGVGVYGCRVCT